METLTDPRPLVTNARYADERRTAIDALELTDVDDPIVDIVEAFELLPYCFTLQCCYGHFVTAARQDEHSLEAIPDGHSGSVRYRMAYVAFCVENTERGRAFLDKLSRIPAADPSYIQLGSADWFWDQWVNSYILQVEPAAHRFKDQAALAAGEAVHTQRVRDAFFAELRRVLSEELDRLAA